MARLYIKANESFPDGWKAVVIGQIDKAADCLGPKFSDFSEGIHIARTCLKKVRAGLRLVRGEIGSDIFERENLFFRDTARQIAPIREAQVNVDTLALLMKAEGERLETKEVAKIRLILRERLKVAEDEIRGNRRMLDELQRELRASKKRIQNIEIQNSFDAIERGLRSSYKEGRDNFAAAIAQNSAELYHEWRKSAKDLRYQLNMLRALWPPAMDCYIAELKVLSDLQGEDHDLFVFEQLLASDEELAPLAKKSKQLHAAVARKRRKLQKRMPVAAARVYAEKPNAFIRRMEGYWNIRNIGKKEALVG